MCQITKDIQLTIDRNPINLRLTKLDHAKPSINLRK